MTPTLAMPYELAVPGLTRTPDHVYSWADPDGVRSPIPSVTSIIKLIDKSGPLVGWAKRTVAECAIRNLDTLGLMKKEGGDQAAIDWLKRLPDVQRDRAADRGTSVHQIAEQIIRGNPPSDIPEELAPYVNSYLGWAREWQPKFVAVEQMICSLTHDYAGTFDAIADIDGVRWLLDWKTGGAYFETALQLAAYGAAQFIGRPGDPTRYRMPRVQRFGVVHITPDGAPAKLIPYKVDKGTFTAFLRAREVWAWTQGAARTVIGKPLTREGEAVA